LQFQILKGKCYKWHTFLSENLRNFRFPKPDLTPIHGCVNPLEPTLNYFQAQACAPTPRLWHRIRTAWMIAWLAHLWGGEPMQSRGVRSQARFVAAGVIDLKLCTHVNFGQIWFLALSPGGQNQKHKKAL
jgi:hypothetical protein